MSDPRKKRNIFLSKISITVILFNINAKNKKMKSLLNGLIILVQRNIIKDKYIPVHLAHKKN